MNSDQKKQMAYFDQAARTWDEKPNRIRLAAAVAQALEREIRLEHKMNAMEYGCGTGLVSVAIAHRVGSITAADISPEMLKVLDEKTKDMGIENITTMLLDLTRHPLPRERFHLIYTSMTLHHIGPVEKLIEKFYRILHPGGWLSIADLDKEDGDFHGDVPGVAHQGFERTGLEALLAEKGFSGIRAVTAHEIVKEIRPGRTKRFPVFLMTGRKQG